MLEISYCFSSTVEKVTSSKLLVSLPPSGASCFLAVFFLPPCISKTHFSQGIFNLWLPRESVDIPSLEVYNQGQVGWSPRQPHLMGGSPAHSKGLEIGGFKVLSNPSHCMIL